MTQSGASPGIASASCASDGYAMNMRAAEAIVNSAPKPMKIFPIREVWSQVELSLLLAAGGRGGRLGRSYRQRRPPAAVPAAGGLSCSARSTSLS